MSRALLILGAVALGSAERAWAAAVTVREPAFGLPHIYADTDLELARENGRQVARDRLAQLILLARVGRGTLYQALGLLDPDTLDNDIEARTVGYTSSELQRMLEVLPRRDQDLIVEYCRGVNDTIEAIYSGELPEPLEIAILRLLGLGADLFGNAGDLSDQPDPYYAPPGGSDPEHPNAGFQFTPELALSIAVLETRNFGLGGFDEAARLAELRALIEAHGESAGTAIWNDRNFLNDPLAPVSVPDPRTPGFRGPLGSRVYEPLAALASRFPAFDYAASSAEVRARRERRAEVAKRFGAWPMLGSYAWAIGGGKTASGYPSMGGFPQTGFLTPSLMHFMEHRSAEGADHRIAAAGMEFVGGPFILIGHTDFVGYTTTTAQLRVVDTFFEKIVGENADHIRYVDAGIPTLLPTGVERISAPPPLPPVELRLWRSHSGTRPIVDFVGDAEGTVDTASPTTLTDAGAFGSSFAGGHVAIVDGAGAGRIRSIASADSNTLTLAAPWSAPGANSRYVAVRPGNAIIAVALDSPVWLEESLTALAFSRLQRAESILDVRAAARMIPSTHNFVAADNRRFNGIGTSSGRGGNIGYWSSGFSRVRQGGEDPRLPLDGSVPNPLLVIGGRLTAATANTLVSASAPFVQDFSPPAVNARYQNPDAPATEFIVTITSGHASRQTRRIVSNAPDTLVVEAPFGAIPAPGDSFEVYEILAMPEAINPSELYTANWNNKAATADEGADFGRQHRNTFILEALAHEDSWDLEKQIRLNDDLAGLDGRGRYGQLLIPRLRQAVDASGDGGNPQIEAVLSALEVHDGPPHLGRHLTDPLGTTSAGELVFLDRLINDLARAIYGDEYAGAIGVPGGTDAMNLVQHAIDSAAGDLPGSYAQAYASDYFNGASWEAVVHDTLGAAASSGIPADLERPLTTYAHPLSPLYPELVFEPTLLGNRGVWEQIVETGPVVRGVFSFPLGQSGFVEAGPSSGFLPSVRSIDRHFTSLQPIFRDWRFVPILRIAEDLAGGASGDRDADGVLDGYERWYFGDTKRRAKDDRDVDGATLLEEFLVGSDPTSPDTDEDGFPDGADPAPQDRLRGAGPVSGQLLSLRDRAGDPGERRLLVRSKDPAVQAPAAGSAGDPTLGGAVLRILNRDPLESAEHPLPASGWRAAGGGEGYFYSDSAQTGGACRSVVIAQHDIQALCSGEGVAFSLDEPSQGSLAVELVLGGGVVYCMEFGGEVHTDFGTGRRRGGAGRFLATNAPAPAACGP